MGQSLIQRSFVGGEIAPALAARADLAKYLAGLRTCRNFFVRKEGGVSNRPGTRFIAETKTPTSPSVQLLRYVSEIAGSSILIEAGLGYLRFYKAGALITLSGVAAWSGATAYVIGDIVVSGGVNYYCILGHTNQVPPNATFWYAMPGSTLELPTPFGAGLFNWHQSGRTITLTHYDVEPRELIYVSDTTWIIRKITTAPGVAAPTNVILTIGGAGSRSYGYVVTAASPDYEESIASAQVINAAAAEPTAAAPHVLTWTAVPNAPEYYVYCDPFANGTYGFIGTATGAASFRDVGFVPDFSVTPPLARTLFDTTNNFPHTSAHYQQRRLFGHTHTSPEGIWGSRIGFPSNFGISSPLQDDDAITFRLAGRQHNPIRHLIPLKTLVVLTDAGGWTVGEKLAPLTPSNLPADQELYLGADDVAPAILGNAIVYVQVRGSIVRDVRFDEQVEGLAGRDLTVYATHLFEGKTIKRLDYQATPHSIVWAIRNDGVLLGLTYIPEQDVWGWHRHDTGGTDLFTDLCVVPEGEEDAVYVITRRVIGGVNKRYIERLESRNVEAATFNADAFFVDSGLSYTGTPISTATGLGHLEGRAVVALVDGVVKTGLTVSAGSVALGVTGSDVHVGLAITADQELLDIDVQGSSVRDRKKRVQALSLLLEKSSRTFKAGPTVNDLVALKSAAFESPSMKAFTGLVDLQLLSHFTTDGRTFIRHTDPLPLSILGVIPNVEVGG